MGSVVFVRMSVDGMTDLLFYPILLLHTRQTGAQSGELPACAGSDPVHRGDERQCLGKFRRSHKDK